MTWLKISIIAEHLGTHTFPLKYWIAWIDTSHKNISCVLSSVWWSHRPQVVTRTWSQPLPLTWWLKSPLSTPSASCPHVLNCSTCLLETPALFHFTSRRPRRQTSAFLASFLSLTEPWGVGRKCWILAELSHLSGSSLQKPPGLCTPIDPRWKLFILATFYFSNPTPRPF